MPKELPIVDIRRGDQFAVRRSMRTGWFLLYHIRRHPGAGYEDEDRIGMYLTQREASTVCNRLRREEERVRAEWEMQSREEVWAAHNVRVMAGGAP